MDERVIRTYIHNNLMNKTSGKNITTRSIILISAMMITSGLMLFSFNLNTIMAIPADIVEGGGDYIYGRTVGIAENENGEPLWIISGTWVSNLSNKSQAGDNSTFFEANFEMIKSDGTAKHAHTLTNFVLTDIANENNATVYNGTGTISMPDMPFTDVPISIKVMSENLGVINIDPTKVDNHFGYTKPIYGVPLEGSEHKDRK